MTDFLARLLTRRAEPASFRPRFASRFEIAIPHVPVRPEALDLSAEDESADQAADNRRIEVVHPPSEEDPARARRFVPPSANTLPLQPPSVETDRPETTSERVERHRSAASIEDSLAQLRGDLDLLSRRRDGGSAPTTGIDSPPSRPRKRKANPSLDHVSTTQVSSRPRRRRQIEDQAPDGLELRESVSAEPSVVEFRPHGARAASQLKETALPSAERSLGVGTRAATSALEPTLKPTATVRTIESPIGGWQSPLPSRALPLSPEPGPTVHVTIGRIEVRAVPNDPSPRRERKRSPQVTLEEYLRRRSEVAR
jgi:hypothetical protein